MLLLKEKISSLNVQNINVLTCPVCIHDIRHWCTLPAICPNCRVNLLPLHGIKYSLVRRLRYYKEELDMIP